MDGVTRSRRPAARAARGEAGTAIIEAALTLPLLLLVVVGICDFGLLFQRYGVVTNAAREGARVAVLPGYTTGDVTARVQSYLAAGGVNEAPVMTVAPLTITPAGGGVPYTAVSVTVESDHTFSFLAPIAALFGGDFGTVTLTATSVMRTEVAAGG